MKNKINVYKIKYIYFLNVFYFTWLAKQYFSFLFTLTWRTKMKTKIKICLDIFTKNE